MANSFQIPGKGTSGLGLPRPVGPRPTNRIRFDILMNLALGLCNPEDYVIHHDELSLISLNIAERHLLKQAKAEKEAEAFVKDQRKQFDKMEREKKKAAATRSNHLIECLYPLM